MSRWCGSGIFTAPNLAAANAAQFLLGAAWIPMFFFLNLYLQQVLGLGAFASGAALLPLTVTIMVGMVGFAPRLIARFGPKTMTVTGLATLAGGLVWLVVHPPRRQLHRRRAASQPGRSGWYGDGVHPLPRDGTVGGGS